MMEGQSTRLFLKRAGLLFAFAVLAAVVSGAAPAGAAARGVQIIRIGTGGVRGTYFPIGNLIAQVLTYRPKGRCQEPDGCGIANVVAVAQLSSGSVSNVKNLGSGMLEAGMVQADVARWAYTGTGVFAGKPPIRNLRLIANLYPETIHVVARRDARIRNVMGLRGKRVALDEPDSGTLVDARIVLSAYGLSVADLTPQFIKPGLALKRVQAGKLDAFFIVAGYPVASVATLADRGEVDLIPIEGNAAAAIVSRYPFFTKDVIPQGTYAGIKRTPTLSVRAQLLVRAELADDLVYRMTRLLWGKRSRRLLDEGHPKGRLIRLDKALAGTSVPLHSGAERFYREKGLLR